MSKRTGGGSRDRCGAQRRCFNRPVVFLMLETHSSRSVVADPGGISFVAVGMIAENGRRRREWECRLLIGLGRVPR
jgi:hypothetical protein